MDLFGPLPATEQGHKWILIAEDLASRWVELFALKEATAENCAATLLNEVFLRYGTPRRIITDNGTQFISAIMQCLTFCLDITQTYTPVYHPQANPVERKNRDLKTQLAILVQDNHTLWEPQLPAIRFALNTAKCQSTGYTPAYLTFGRELRTIDDVHHDLRAIVEAENFIPQITPKLLQLSETLEKAREKVENLQDKNKALGDKKRRPQPSFTVGEQVLVTTHSLSKASKNYTSKFVPKRDGPYTIIKQFGTTTFQVAHADRLDTPLGNYHVSALTKYQNPGDHQPVRILRTRGRPKNVR